jgi:hypothetical protein
MQKFSLYIQMQWRSLDKRPTGITAVAILCILGGAISICLGAIIILFADTAIGILTVPIGIFNLFVGYGLLKGKRWSWTCAVLGYSLNIAFSVVDILMGTGHGSGISVAFSGIILYYLTWSTTRRYFVNAKKVISHL